MQRLATIALLATLLSCAIRQRTPGADGPYPGAVWAAACAATVAGIVGMGFGVWAWQREGR
jgi:hypothetical protein